MNIWVRLLLAGGLMIAARMLPADTVYVTDILQLALHEEERSTGRLLRNLPSGTQLELLERKGNYAKVMTQDGVSGWTKSLFLVNEEPARFQLSELTTRNQALESNLSETRSRLHEAESLVTQLQTDSQACVRQAGAHAETIARLEKENEQLRLRVVDQDLLLPAKWSLVAVAASLLLGFIGGIAWFDYRSRKRHGGYRIY